MSNKANKNPDQLILDDCGITTGLIPAELERQRLEHLQESLIEIGKKNKSVGAFMDNAHPMASILDAQYTAFDRDTHTNRLGRDLMARNYNTHNTRAYVNFVLACGSCAVNHLCPYRSEYGYFEGQNHYAAQRKKFLKKLEDNPSAPCFPLPKYR